MPARRQGEQRRAPSRMKTSSWTRARGASPWRFLYVLERAIDGRVREEEARARARGGAREERGRARRRGGVRSGRERDERAARRAFMRIARTMHTRPVAHGTRVECDVLAH